MSDDAPLFDIFMEVQRGLPRQGPGDDESTRQALALCGALPERPTVLDVGCGPGMQTIALAEALPDAVIVAVDIHQEYLELLRQAAAAAGMIDRIHTLRGDMTALPVPAESADLIWSEGAAYVMGVATALAAWNPLLKPGGCIAYTELVWLRPDPPAEAASFFADEYPAMGDIAGNLTMLRTAGYEPLGHFTLPDAAWWDHYYTPLESKLPALSALYAHDDAALGVVDMTRREIEMRRRFPNCYGYEFFVGRKPA